TNLTLSNTTISAQSTINVSVDITNTGQYTGKEVVQLYLKDEIGSVLRPDKELKSFQKIELAAGATKTVSFTITPDMLRFTGVR
ncbi:MAG: fibronectin type III-like domain-contianing protein, partial [Saprospiraceae bacterium]